MTLISRANTTHMNPQHHISDSLKTTTVPDRGCRLSKEQSLTVAQFQGLKVDKGDWVNVTRNKDSNTHTITTKKTGEELRKEFGFFGGSARQSVNATQTLGQKMVENPKMAVAAMGGAGIVGVGGTYYAMQSSEDKGKREGARLAAGQMQGMPGSY